MIFRFGISYRHNKSVQGFNPMAETSEKLASIAARVVRDGVCSQADAQRLAASVLRQKEKKARKKALRNAGVV